MYNYKAVFVVYVRQRKDYRMCTAAKNWKKPTETSRISVVRDVADRFWGWQQLTNYRDPENKSGLWVGTFLKSKDLLKTTRNSDNLVAPPGE